MKQTNYRPYKSCWLEKLLVLGIGIMIAIFAVQAHAGMNLRTHYEVCTDNEKEVVRLLNQDPNLEVVIVLYAETWTWQGKEVALVRDAMELEQRIEKRFPTRASVLFANKAGLVGDRIPTPAKNGLYFYLD